MKKKLGIILLLLFICIPHFNISAASADHIIINQVYGANQGVLYNAPVSNSFVELYNPTENAVDLTGWSLQYAETGTDWMVFRLSGYFKGI